MASVTPDISRFLLSFSCPLFYSYFVVHVTVRILSTLLLLSGSTVTAAGCSMASCTSDAAHTFKSTFSVAITHNGKPIRGASIKVEPIKTDETGGNNTRAEFSAVTDNQGIAVIKNLKPGDYTLSASYLGIGAGWDCFRVGKEVEGQDKVSYEWGEMPVGVQAVAGTVREWVPSSSASPIERVAHIHGSEVGIAGVRLSLVEPDTKNTRETSTGSDGNFVLPDVPAGEYVLVLTSTRSDIPGASFLLEVSPSSRRSSLSLLLLTTSCGPGFELKP
jgi:hypothetical protein